MPTVEQLADVVATTLTELGRGKFSDLTGDLQEYVAFNEIFKKNRVTQDSGKSITFNIMNGTSGAARNVALYEADDYDVDDVMLTGSVPWRHQNSNWTIEEHEVSMNSGASQIVELVKVRRSDGIIDFAKLTENNFWGKPSSSSDTLKPYGIDYWAVRNATEGFTGGIPSGFSDVAGVSPTTYTRWKNWSANYTSITPDDLVAKAIKALTYCNFMPPLDLPTYNTGTKWSMYSNYAMCSALDKLQRAQNDNLGSDLGSRAGTTLIKSTPVKWVPQLDADTTNPIYGINWGLFKTTFLRGWYMKETKPRPSPVHHNCVVTDLDNTMNWVCRDRRGLFVLYA